MNSLFSEEASVNLNKGEQKKVSNYLIKFNDISKTEIDNYTSLRAEIEVASDEKELTFYPELKLYKIPETITSEADIKTNLFNDNLVVVNYLKDTDYLNIRYQKKPFMLLIWLSAIMLAVGGLLGLRNKFKMKLRLSFILIFITIIFVFLIFFKSLYEDKVYIPKQLNNKIENISAKEFYSDDNMELKNLFEDHEYILINIWASWCLPCRQEHPYITKISKFDNLKVIGLNYKDKKNNAQNFLDELGNPYDIILKDLDGTKSIFLGAFGVPESFLVDKELNLLKKYIGPIDSESTIEVKKLLK